ncbi:hypothetical protein ACFVY0_11765 [Streptomyces sp. NPDC058286]|uniref:hypothetical protein n=1 Tax=Streptomyces sp. NPDC058286 TaxID=3346422 RepID=UPI0036EE3892
MRLSIARGVLFPLALSAVAAGAFAGPVHAQDTLPSVTGLPSQIAVTPVTQSGVKQPRQLRLSVAAGERVPKEYVLRLDLSGLEGVADVDAAPCDVVAGLATCRIKVTDPDRVPGASVSLTLRAATGSKPGDSGVLRVTGEADGHALKATDAAVEIGGANLVTAGGRLPGKSGVGDTLPIPMSFRNVGSLPASGVLMAFRFTEGSKPAGRFANCEYGEHSSFQEKHYVLCAFDVDVPAGAEFRLPEEAAVEVGSAAFNELVQVSVFPDAPGMREYLRGGHPYERGSGAELKLREAAEGATAYGNDTNWESTYYVSNSADLSVSGAEISGKVGDVVVADLGLRNHGPAWLGDVQDPTEFASLHVELPDGVAVVDLPKHCAPGTSGAYYCRLGPLASDAELSFPFKLRMEKPLKETRGKVRVRQAEWSGYDKNASNDSADISFTITAGTASPDASATPGAGTTGDATGEHSPGTASPSAAAPVGDEPDDGGLASTGTGLAMWSAALAALLVAGGIAVRVAARKRRA